MARIEASNVSAIEKQRLRNRHAEAMQQAGLKASAAKEGAGALRRVSVQLDATLDAFDSIDRDLEAASSASRGRLGAPSSVVPSRPRRSLKQIDVSAEVPR